LFEISGKEQRACTWTGLKLQGADNRLPLLASDERRRHMTQGERARLSRRAGKGASRQLK
jgi:hypothetical protein